MALHIKQEGSKITLSGNLNSATSMDLENHFGKLMQMESDLTVNLSQLNRIEMSGISTIQKIKHQAHLAYKSIRVSNDFYRENKVSYRPHLTVA